MKNKKIILVWIFISTILILLSFHSLNRLRFLEEYPLEGIYPFEKIESPDEYSSFLSLFVPLILVFLEIVLLGICYLLSLIFEFIKKFFVRNYAGFSSAKVSLLAFILTIIVNLFFAFEALIGMF